MNLCWVWPITMTSFRCFSIIPQIILSIILPVTGVRVIYSSIETKTTFLDLFLYSVKKQQDWAWVKVRLLIWVNSTPLKRLLIANPQTSLSYSCLIEGFTVTLQQGKEEIMELVHCGADFRERLEDIICYRKNSGSVSIPALESSGFKYIPPICCGLVPSTGYFLINYKERHDKPKL